MLEGIKGEKNVQNILWHFSLNIFAVVASSYMTAEEKHFFLFISMLM